MCRISTAMPEPAAATPPLAAHSGRPHFGQCYLVVNNEHVAAVVVCFSPTLPSLLFFFVHSILARVSWVIQIPKCSQTLKMGF